MSFSVHGESITDGNASGGIAVTLYESGSTTVRTLGAKEVLHVTDVRIQLESDYPASLVSDSKAAGRYLVHGRMSAKGGVIIHFSKPYVCPPGTGLKFYGADNNLNTCLIEGFIREG